MVKARERIELAAGWAEWDRDSFVRVGDRAIPGRIDATLPSSPDKWPSLHMTIEVRDGVPRCIEVTMRAHPEGREVRGVDVRAIRLDDWIENIAAEAAVDIDESTDGTVTFKRSLASTLRTGIPAGGIDATISELAQALNNDDEREFRAARESIRGARTTARRTVTDELLEQVADTYRLHVTDRPVEAVQSAFGTSHRTAARYVQIARAKGFLPPTTHGKAKA